MQISSIVQKGEFHPVYCEDYLFEQALTESIHIAAVMDGCTMGADSHFASALIGKLLKKVAKEVSYQEYLKTIPAFSTTLLNNIGRNIIQKVREELRRLSNELYLDELELLSTLILAIVNTETNNVWVVVVGDGCIGVNGEIIEVDQQNRPDYLGYHLSGPFEDWFEVQQNQFEFSNITKLSIATDGVLSFEKLVKSAPAFPGNVPVFLMLDNHPELHSKSIHKKIDTLKNDFGLIGTDDLGIIKMKW